MPSKGFSFIGHVILALLIAPLAVGAVTAQRLVEALKAGHRDAVRALAKNPSEINSADADGTTPLHWAVRADDLEAVQLLLRGGASAKAANRYGVTPLSLAATNGNAAIVEQLLKAGADANGTVSQGQTVLMTAAPV